MNQNNDHSPPIQNKFNQNNVQNNPLPIDNHNHEGNVTDINSVKLQEIISSFFPSISSKSSDELFSLLTIENEFLEYFNSLPEVINQKINLQDFELGNEELAADNLSYEKRYNELRNEIEQKGRVIKELEDQFQGLKRKESELFNRYNPKVYLTNLKQEKTRLDIEATELSDKFLVGEIELDSYIQKYKDIRKKFHLHDILLLSSSEIKTLDINDNPITFMR